MTNEGRHLPFAKPANVRSKEDRTAAQGRLPTSAVGHKQPDSFVAQFSGKPSFVALASNSST